MITEETLFEFFLFFALASILCSRAEQFEQFLVDGLPWNNPSFVEICQVVTEEMLFEVVVVVFFFYF